MNFYGEKLADQNSNIRKATYGVYDNKRKMVNQYRRATIPLFPTGLMIIKQLYFKNIRYDPSSLYHRNVKFCLLKTEDYGLH